MNTDRIFVPPEWAEQSSLWVGWPHLRNEWGAAFDGACEEIALFVRAASRLVPIHVACGSDLAFEHASTVFQAHLTHVRLVRVPAGDIWLRDTAPILAQQADQAVALCFRFNGWGGKYVMPGDAETSAAIAKHIDVPVVRHDFVLEGGAIELDGTGRLLTTRQCVLNPNRNPDWREEAAETALKTAFGVRQIVWLEAGLANDHTDGHVDNIVRFIGPGHVLCQRASGTDDPNAELYMEIAETLTSAGLTVSTIASPGLISNENGEALPASHMNYTLVNSGVLVPIYEADYSAEAVAELATLFPDRQVIALPAHHILTGGGSFHCMTREVPTRLATKSEEVS